MLTKLNELSAMRDIDQDTNVSLLDDGQKLTVATDGITLEITNTSITRIA